MGLKVKIVEINGEKRVHPEAMKLLLEFGGHKNVCDECGEAMAKGTGYYCATGKELFLNMLKHPDIEYFND